MSNYLVIEDNKVVNVIVADTAEIAAEITGKEVVESTSSEPWLDWTRFGNTWSAPVEPELEVTTEIETEVTE